MERKKFLKLSMLLVVMVMSLFWQPNKVLATNATNETILTGKTGTLTITKVDSTNSSPIGGVKYTLYKIADIKQKINNGEVKLEYIVVTALENEKLTLDSGYVTIADLISNINAIDTEDKLSTINNYAEQMYTIINDAGVTGTESAATDDNGATTIYNIEEGVYLVYESGKPAGVTAGQSFVITMPMAEKSADGTTIGWNYDVEAKPKNTLGDISTIGKSIVSSDEASDNNPSNDTGMTKNAICEIGDTITYRIDAGIPENVEELKYYVIEDAPDSSLEVDEDSIIVLAGSSGTSSYTNLTRGDNKEYQISKSTDGKILIYFATTALANYDNLYIYISATLENTAILGDANGNTNTANLKYSKITSSGSTDPSKPSDDDELQDGTKAGEDPKVYTYGINLTKSFEGNQDDKSGVTFELLVDDGDDKKTVNVSAVTDTNNNVLYYYLDENGNDTITTDNRGEIKIKGLAEGTYYLKETSTKAGYVLLSELIPIVIKNNSSTTTVDVKAEINEAAAMDEDSSGYFAFTVLNKKGFTLPSTGGRGIYIFTITGLLIMAGAVVLMVKNKKKSK